MIKLAGLVLLGLMLSWGLKAANLFQFRKTAKLKLSWLQGKLTWDECAILLKKSIYYQNLSDRSKKLFEKRVADFLNTKTFIPRNLADFTQEMKLSIAATAIQVTYGLPSVSLAHFKYLLVYPDEYYSTITRNYHKGEVNPKLKAIVLSWKYFELGNAEQEGINLGLHEIAHALRLENRIRNGESGFFKEAIMERWDKLAFSERVLINSGQNSFFRDYGGTDNEEFFAVVVENYFERPGQLVRHNRELYFIMCSFLNQNPLLMTNELA
jgi:MtfA peptidase